MLMTVGCDGLDRTPGCNSDSDCKGARVCIAEECVEAGTQNTQPTPTGTTPKPAAKKSCNEVVTACNCGYTAAYNGTVVQSTECASGFYQYSVCGQCPSGGLAWTTNCKCYLSSCSHGGIGRRESFKNFCLRAWGFKSLCEYGSIKGSSNGRMRRLPQCWFNPNTKERVFFASVAKLAIRARLRILWSNPWGFESLQMHGRVVKR